MLPLFFANHAFAISSNPPLLSSWIERSSHVSTRVVAQTDPEDRERLTRPIGECLVQVTNIAEMPVGLVVHSIDSLFLVLMRLWRCPQGWS